VSEGCAIITVMATIEIAITFAVNISSRFQFILLGIFAEGTTEIV
jgi:hypothetical protein